MQTAIDRISTTEARKLLRAQATEKQIQSAIVEYLATQKIPHSITNAERSYNNNGQLVRRISPGWPDVTACFPGGLFGAIEVKSRSGRLRPEQARMLDALYQAGAMVVVARSVDDVISVLATGRIRDCDIAEIVRYKDKPVKRRAARRDRR